MEGRHYVAIFLIVFGIVHVYSYPQPADDPAPRKLTLDVTPHDSYIQMMALGDEAQDVGRIKREQPASPTKSTKSNKEDRLIDLRRTAVEADRRTAAVRRRILVHQASFNQTEHILDGYAAEGATRAEAIERLEREHPHLADPFRGQRIGSQR